MSKSSWAAAMIVGLCALAGCRDQSAADLTLTPGAVGVPHVAFLSIKGASPGETASVAVETQPRARCTIEYIAPTGATSEADGLSPKTADDRGQVSWSWAIDRSTPRGVGIVTVRCDRAGRSVPLGIGQDINSTPSLGR